MRIINLYQKNKKASEHTRERMLKDYIYIYIYVCIYVYKKEDSPFSTRLLCGSKIHSLMNDNFI